MAKDDKKKSRFRGRKRVMDTEDAMTKMVTNRRSKTTTWSSRIKDVIKAHGADGAQQRLGVSKSTLRAWARGKRAPNAANANKLRTEHDTATVRTAQVSKRRQRQLDRMASAGAKLTFRASVGPRDEMYKRFRRIKRDVPPEVAEAMNQAFINDGPDAAREVLIDFMREYFQENQDSLDPGMEIYLDDITDIKLEPN